jgi:hypothetical protein
LSRAEGRCARLFGTNGARTASRDFSPGIPRDSESPGKDG